MNEPELLLAERRAARNAARAHFDRVLGLAKTDLAPPVLKRRVVAEAQRTALSLAREAIDIASDSRGIVATTGGLLVLWLARRPILAGAKTLLNRFKTRRTPKSIGDRIKLLKADTWRKLKDYADE